MTIVEFWKQGNSCTEPDCDGCKRAEAILLSLAEHLPTVEQLVDAAQVDADEPMELEMEKCSRVIRHLLSAACIVGLFSTFNPEKKTVNRAIAASLVSYELAKAVRLTDIRMPVAVVQPFDPKVFAEMLKGAGPAPPDEIKH